MKTARFLLYPLFVLLALLNGQRAIAQTVAATLTVDAPNTTQFTGDTFTVAITATDLTIGLSGAEMEVTFDDSVVAFRTFESGGLLAATGREGACAPADLSATDRVRLVCATAGDTSGVSADGTLFTLTFEAVGAGVSPIGLANPLLVDDGRPPLAFSADTVADTVTVEQTVLAVGLHSAETITPTHLLLALFLLLLFLTTIAHHRSKLSRFHTFLNLLLICSLTFQTFIPPLAAATHAPRTTYHAPHNTHHAPRSPLSNFFADLNGDQRVDGNDLQRMIGVWSCENGDGCYSADLDFNSDNLIDVIDLASVGNEFDIAPPTIIIDTPTENAVVTGNSVIVSGTFSDDHAVTEVLVNGQNAMLGDSTFSAELPISDGVLPIHVAAVDAIGQPASATRLVTVDGEGPFITVNAPANRQAIYTTRPDFTITYTDLAALVDETTLQVTLTDEADQQTDITNLLTTSADNATGTLTFDLQEDETYSVTVSVRDTNGVLATQTTNFYVPVGANTIAPPTAVDNAGFVSGRVYDSTTCAGEQQFDPINCTGIAGAVVTLEQVDPSALTVARSARQADLNAARTTHGLPHQAGRAPQPFKQSVTGTIITGPDGFFAFPVAQTGNYVVRVEKEGFTYGQRLSDIVLEKSTPTTNIYLTPLDSAVTPCDETGCQHTSADGQMELDVPAGAIPEGVDLDITATQFDQVQFLPSGELPPGTAETYAFNLSGAAEITFTHPITVMLKNDRGFAAGTAIPLGYWNQELLVWEHAGEAVVDVTEEWLVMQVTHFSNYDPNAPVTSANAELTATDETAAAGENCASDCDSSAIEIASGGLRQDFALPTVTVLDQPAGLTMLYDSLRADGTAVIDIALNLETLAGDQIDGLDRVLAELFIEGESTEQFSFGIDELEEDGEIGRFRFFWDGRDAQGRKMPPGFYDYVVRVKIPFQTQFFFTTDGTFGGPPDPTQPTGVPTAGFIDEFITGSVLLNGATENQLGRGWQVADVQRLYTREDGSVYIDNGAHVQTAYLLPSLDLIDNTPTVRTLDSEQAAVNSEQWAVNSEQWGRSRVPATDVSSNITTDTTWTVANSPYRLLNDITVEAGTTLTVEAGVLVQAMETTTDLIVEGALVATGTQTQTIVFTSDEDGTQFNGGGGEWGGILVDGGSADFTHTTIRFGGNGNVDPNEPFSDHAALVVKDGTLSFVNSTLFRNGDRSERDDAYLHIEDSTVRVENSLLTDDRRNSANPAFGVRIVDSGATELIFEGNHIIHKARVIRMPIQLLDAIAPTNQFSAGQDERISFDGGTVQGDVRVEPIGTLATFDFRGDMQFNGDLTIAQGVRFASGSNALADITISGGVLEAVGSADSPITFDAIGAAWRGIHAINGAHLHIEHAAITAAIVGVRLTDSSGEIAHSTFDSNQTGILFEGAIPNFLARANSFQNSTSAAVSNPSTSVVDMRLNFWDSPLGPIHPNNPNGDGEQINGGARVLIDPFLTEAGADGNTAVNLTTFDTTTLVRDADTGGFTRFYPDGNSVHFNAAGLHTHSRDTHGNEYRYSYNGDNSLASVGFVASGTGQADWVWTFEYDVVRDACCVTHSRTMQHAIRITDPADRETILTIDKNGNLSALQEPGLSAPLTFAYGADGRMTHKTDARGNTTTYEFDERGRMRRSLLPPRTVFDVTTGTFSVEQESHDFVPADVNAPTINELPSGTPAFPNAPLAKSDTINSTQSINGRAYVQTTNRFGAHTGYVDPLGNAVAIERDARDRVVKVVSAENNCTTYTYDDLDNMLTMSELDAAACAGGVGLTRTMTNTYEPRFNQVKTQTDALGRTTTFVYDYEEDAGESGNLVRKIYPPVRNENGVIVVAEEQFSYNVQGQLTEFVDVRGIVTCYVYTSADDTPLFADGVTPIPNLLTQIVDDCGGALERHTIMRDFNALGQAQTIEEPFDDSRTVRTTTYAFDERGRLIETVEALGRIEQRSYDNHDNLVQIVSDVTGRPMTTSYTYNEIDQRLTQTFSGEGEQITMRTGYDLNRNIAFEQDGSGNITTYEYDASNRLTTLTDALGNAITYEYDGDSRLTRLVNKRGFATTYTYDGLNRQTQQAYDPAGLNFVTQSTYDLLDNILTTTDANGVVICFAYDAWDRLTTVTRDCGGLNATSQVAYSLTGMIAAETDPLGRTYRYDFDRLDRSIAMTNPVGDVFTTEFDAGDHVIAETDMLGRTTTYSYDLRHRQTSITDALGGVQTFTYDSRDNLVTMVDEIGRTTTYQFDVFNRQTAVTDATGATFTTQYNDNSQTVTATDALGRPTHFAYDALNRVVGTTDALGGQRIATFDPHNNLIETVDENGNATAQAYDSADRLTRITDPLGNATTFTFDNIGNQTSVSDPLNHTVQQVYDDLYRVVQIIDEKGDTTTLAYDLNDNILTMTDPISNTHMMVYDTLDRLLSQTNESGDTRSFVYDEVGNQTQRTDRNGRTRTFSYDALNRVTAENWVGASYAASYTYDAAGQMAAASDPSAAYAFAYDGVGRVTRRDESFGSADVDFRYQYDAVGNQLRQFELINGGTTAETEMQFDGLNRPILLTQTDRNDLSKQVTMQYDPASRLTQMTRDAVVSTQYGYDAENKLTNITHQTSSRATRSYGLTYDAAERLTQLSSPSGASSYTYDDFDQLLTATHDFQSAEAYSYDANGNRSDQTTGADNRLLNDGTFSYEYDGEGNRTRKIHNVSGFSAEYEWDYRNRLTRVVNKDDVGTELSSVTYTHNLFDERIQRADSSGTVQQFAVSGNAIQLILDGDGNPTNRYLHGTLIDMVLVDEQIGGDTLYPLTDHQMTARDLADSDGNIVNQRTFDSFGNLTSESNPTVDYHFGYSGREPDVLAGINYHRARYYDPSVGKFLSEDPIEFLAGDANLTRYVGNQPINQVDPWGLNSDIPDFVKINRDNGAKIPLSEQPRMSDSFVGGVNNRRSFGTTQDVLEAAADLDRKLNGPVGFQPGSKLQGTNIVTGEQLQAQAVQQRKNFKLKQATQAVKQNRLNGLNSAGGAGKLAGFFRVLAFLSVAADGTTMFGETLASLYEAQSRIEDHERVERQREFVEDRLREIRNERIRKENAEKRKQAQQERDAANRRVEEERRQQAQQDDVIRQQAEKEKQFIEEQRRKQRNRGSGSTSSSNAQPEMEFNFDTLQWEQKKQPKQPDAPTTPTQPPPPSDPSGLVGLARIAQERERVNGSNGGSQARDNCFPDGG